MITCMGGRIVRMSDCANERMSDCATWAEFSDNCEKHYRSHSWAEFSVNCEKRYRSQIGNICENRYRSQLVTIAKNTTARN